jgi:hypothetical protein
VALVRRHPLIFAVAALGLCSLALFTWAEWHYFVDQARSHKQAAPGFWSGEHVHDWLYNAASNWQSEMLFGVLVVALLHRLPGDRDET